MRAARFFIYGIPALLLALVVASFVNVAFLARDKKNEMSIGMMGEPSTLNPIKQADSAASQVNATIFNGLLKYNEDLEISADLARSWELSQTTTIFFVDSAAASTGLAAIEARKTEWEDWKLTAARREGARVLLTFSLPGLTTSEKIVSSLDPSLLAEHVILRLEAPEGLRKMAEELRTSEVPPFRVWVESDAAIEVTLDPDSAAAFVQTLGDRAKAQEIERVRFLAEPLVVFHLRDDVRWHDGAPFTSRDVLFTYRAITADETASPRKPDFDLIIAIEAPDTHTVRVTYRKPYSPALNSWMMSMLPAHLLEDKPQSWWATNFDRAPVGTGPYKFDTWKTNEYLRVVRNPDYFDGPAPWLDAIVFRTLPDQLSLRLAFETREVDFWSADPWAVASFQKDSRFDIFSSPSSSYTYVGWNLERPLFQDPLVRRALAHAVDVPAMVRYILYGNGVQSTGIFTPQMWFFNPRVIPFAYDVEKANSLLDEAGWLRGPDGIRTKDGERFSFTLMTNNGNEVRRDIATLVQNALKEVGIEVKVEMYEWAVFLKNYVNKKNFDAIVLGWALGLDFDQFQIWHSSQANPEQLNVVSYKNPEVDRLLEHLRQEYDRQRIIDMAGLMQSIIYRDQPYLFLYVPDSTSVMWKDSYRIRRPGPDGQWIDTPVEMTKAGWSYWSEWFYRPEFADRLP